MNVIAERTATIENIKKMILDRGLTVCFTDPELQHAFNGEHYSRLAARYLAKQLIIENLPAIQNFNDLEILNDPFGKPQLRVCNASIGQSGKQGDLKHILLSLSHSRKYARALVIFEYF